MWTKHDNDAKMNLVCRKEVIRPLTNWELGFQESCHSSLNDRSSSLYLNYANSVAYAKIL